MSIKIHFDLIGSKHQELQVSKMAIPAELQQSLQTTSYRNSLAEQLDGIVVTDALPNATCLPVPQGLQRVVFKSIVRHD